MDVYWSSSSKYADSKDPLDSLSLYLAIYPYQPSLLVNPQGVFMCRDVHEYIQNIEIHSIAAFRVRALKSRENIKKNL